MVVIGMMTNVLMWINLNVSLEMKGTSSPDLMTLCLPSFSSSPPLSLSPPSFSKQKAHTVSPDNQAILFSMYFALQWIEMYHAHPSCGHHWCFHGQSVSHTSAHLFCWRRWSYDVPDCREVAERHMPCSRKGLCCKGKCTWLTCAPYLGMSQCHA